MTFDGVQRPLRVRPFPPDGVKVNGPLSKEIAPTLGYGHVEQPQWRDLKPVDKKQWEMSAFQSRSIWRHDELASTPNPHVWRGMGPNEASENATWVPPSQRQRPPPSQGWEVEQPKALKQRHLYGNVGIITNPQPSTTNTTDFLVRVPYRGEEVRSLPRAEEMRDRKLLEQSSEIFDRPRNLVPSTLSPRQDLFSNNFGDFPFVDTTVDDHAPKFSIGKKPGVQAYSETSAGPSPRASKPAMKFEPPTRPGAAFRRRNEKNFSDLFEYEAPPAAEVKPRHEVDVHTGVGYEVQNRRFPMRMRSAPELPETADVRREMANASTNASTAGATNRRPPAGAGGSSGGEAEARLARQEGQRRAEVDKESAGKIWEAMRNHSSASEDASFDILTGGPPMNEARRRFVTDHSSQVFGEASKTKGNWKSVQSPRVHIPGMNTGPALRFPRSMEKRVEFEMEADQDLRSPGDFSSPRSRASDRGRASTLREEQMRVRSSPRERVNTGLFTRDMNENAIQDTEEMACKAASRKHYQRSMSSDPTDLFGAYLVQPSQAKCCVATGADNPLSRPLPPGSPRNWLFSSDD